MKIYFSTFITGTQEIIKEFLEKRGCKVKLLLDGLVVFKSDCPENEIRRFRIFNNTFILLRSFSNLKPNIKSLERILVIISHSKNLLSQIANNLLSSRRNFKIICSLENRMVSVRRSLLKALEAIILKIHGMRLDIKNPDLEFWVLLRREGYGFFGIRITYPSREEKYRDRGELRKEIAYIMSLISDPSPEDIVIDPFAGYGSIPLERAKNFPYKEIIAVDKDKNLVSRLKEKVKTFKRKITIIWGDALALDEIPDSYVTKIISDPPWGEYKKIPNLEEFYEAMLREFNRILKPNGVIVLLIGAKEIFEKVLQAKFSRVFLLKRKYNILVSGKKAAIYCLLKNFSTDK